MAGYTVVNMNDLDDALEAGPNGLEVETVKDWWTD